MEIQSLKLVCFSPTGTTRAISEGIARGTGLRNMELIDITRPGARNRRLHTYENELLVVAVPVYMGRVPAILDEWLHSIEARKTPAVCVVVYGNRVYDNSLLELKDILIKCGSKPVAGAAFIGEHSFSSREIPTAAGRPDVTDINHAEQFGRKIIDKLNSISSPDKISDITLPGNYPYGGVTNLWSVDFIEISGECTQCGLCSEGCPAGAIDPENSNSVDIEKCITCCACIKNCPQNARTMKPGLVKDAAIRLNRLYSERKEPVYFL
jgi:ferredoxin